MASTRITSQKRRGSPAAAPQTPKVAFTALARHGAHIQLAACSAAASTVAQWAQSADRFAETVVDELIRRVDGKTDSAEMAARVTAASGRHLRELSALPRAATDHFDTRLARISIDHKEIQ
jgi:hypothetical protein